MVHGIRCYLCDDQVQESDLMIGSQAQARHRERNRKTIEDLTAKVSALTAENSNLKLDVAIMNTLSRAKDEHYSKLRKTKASFIRCPASPATGDIIVVTSCIELAVPAQENLAYLEAESLILESFELAHGAGAQVTPDMIETWCMQDRCATPHDPTSCPVISMVPQQSLSAFLFLQCSAAVRQVRPLARTPAGCCLEHISARFQW